jgi:hypothetical protein
MRGRVASWRERGVVGAGGFGGASLEKTPGRDDCRLSGANDVNFA